MMASVRFKSLSTCPKIEHPGRAGPVEGQEVGRSPDERVGTAGRGAGAAVEVEVSAQSWSWSWGKPPAWKTSCAHMPQLSARPAKT